MTFAFVERVMVNPQVSLLDLTIEAVIPGDVMWAVIGNKNIVSVPRHDGLRVNMVKGLLRSKNTSGYFAFYIDNI